jgi:hypothetical protein
MAGRADLALAFVADFVLDLMPDFVPDFVDGDFFFTEYLPESSLLGALRRDSVASSRRGMRGAWKASSQPKISVVLKLQAGVRASPDTCTR